jgi:peptidoglycan/xylan/chitin deacetylase (PgdA/CDA1 family)
MSSRLVVLGWHNVTSTYCFPSGGDSGRRGLYEQLRLLKRVTTVVPLAEALADLAAGRPLPPRAVALTFDDGYRDNLTVAAPMLRLLDLPATCFVVPGLLSRTTTPWWEVLAWGVECATAGELKWNDAALPLQTAEQRRVAKQTVAEAVKRRDRVSRDEAVEEVVTQLAPLGPEPDEDMFLDWDSARELRETMAIGSHSSSHAILSQETPEDQREDLVDARRRIEAELECAAPVLAYPNGGAADYDEATLAAVGAAGHTHAVTTRGGLNDRTTPPFEIRRTVMNPERGAVEVVKVLRDVARSPVSR